VWARRDRDDIVPGAEAETALASWRPTATTWLRAIALAYALFLALIELSRRVGPEQWWLTCLNLYFPQAVWALSGVLLLLLAFAIDRRLALVLALCVLWVLGPLMGLAVVFKRTTAPPEQRLRVMTYNVKYGLGDMRGVAAEILAADPDLLLLQDVGSRVTTYPPLAKFLRTRHVEAEGYLVASATPSRRWTIVRWVRTGTCGRGSRTRGFPSPSITFT
jgi:endonuclease/exonuclease/phosphatase (EEP) superfamily protein YafD